MVAFQKGVVRRLQLCKKVDFAVEPLGKMYAKKYGTSLGSGGEPRYHMARSVVPEDSMTNGSQVRPSDEIRSLLRELRCRLDPGAPALGEHERLGTRRGKAVSQEELAEAVGVSRGWYAMLERGEPIQPSIAMLSRLAGALNATRDERRALFALAIPELHGLF